MEEPTMNACIFTILINVLTPVYAADHATQVDQLNVNDSVCVTEIDGSWAQVHWSNGSAGHTGYIANFKARKLAEPTEPTAREEEYDVPPPTPAPAPQPAPQLQRAPDPRLDQNLFRPSVLAMQCIPQGGRQYLVAYTNGSAATFAASGFKREYPVVKEHDDQSNHVFYVTLQRPDQARAVFLAFDYSQRGEDVSTLATQVPGEPKARDKCWMDWGLTK
jgi:hypothetical protein